MSIGLICNLSKTEPASRAALKHQLTPVLITPLVGAKLWSPVDTAPPPDQSLRSGGFCLICLVV